MDPSTYAVEADIEATHWWFVQRRRLFARELGRLGLTREHRILDIGTSTGTNLRMLRELGYDRVSGVDLSDHAIHYCQHKGLGPVEKGDVRALPFADASFELVLATDIIEHVNEDADALREIWRVLAPGGRVLITVPAFESLWGLQDERSAHVRRYRMKPLLRRVEGSGLEPLTHYYFNYLLFVPIWLARRAIDLFKVNLDSENEVNSPALNRLLSAIFRLDVSTARLVRPPFGVSALVVAKKAVHR